MIDMEKELLLNDQGVKYKCIIEKDNISFEFDKNMSFLNKFITVTNRDNGVYVTLGMKLILTIKNNEITRVLPISSTEIRILRAYYNHFVNRSENIISLFKESKEKIMRNLKALNKKRWDSTQVLNTELHTHLIEILNSHEFIEFINKYNVLYPMNENGFLDFNSEYMYSYEEIVLNGWEKNLESCLSLDFKVGNFDDLENCVNNRNQLMKLAIEEYKSNLDNDKEWIREKERIAKNLDLLNIELTNIEVKILKCNSKKEKNKLKSEKVEINNQIVKLKDSEQTFSGYIVYNDYFEECLKKLKRENISYSEISYSNDTRIKYMSDKHKDDDNFKFLYSIDRLKNVKAFSNAAKSLEPLLESGSVIGIDIMGSEHPLEGEEYSLFKEKLEWILPVLHIHPNSVLRIHASEFKDCTDNILNTLKAIRETANKINESCSDLFGESWGVIPPPRIRIGHGVNINENEELIHLIHDFGAVIEFNISSNVALGHVDDLENLPIKYYDDNDINYVFATDGGGMYSTSLLQEQNIVNNLQTSNSSPRKQEVKSDFVKSAKESEEVEVKSSKSISEVKEDERDLMNKYLDYKDKNFKFKRFESFDEALKYENELFNNANINELDKINMELFKIRRFINDNDLQIDMNYFNTKMNVIEKYCQDKNLSDYAKMYLYLFEKELLKDFDSSFKSVEYLYYIDIGNDSVEDYLKRVLNLVIEQYNNDTREFYNEFNKSK